MGHKPARVQLARVHADRTDEELTAALLELLEQARERRAPFAGDADAMSRFREPVTSTLGIAFAEAFAAKDYDRSGWMRVLCSGFRPAD